MPPPAPPAPLGRAGLFGGGINIDLLEIGALQAFGPGGSASGILLGLGPEIDLGPRAALRVPLELGFAGDFETTSSTTGATRSTSFWQVVIAPSWIYRFRHDREQGIVPYVGGALEMGGFQFGRQLLGLAPSPVGTAQAFLRVGVAPQALAGVLLAPVSWFSLRLAAGYTYLYVANTSLHALSETVAIRFSF